MLSLVGCKPSPTQAPKVEKGLIDIGYWNFEKEPIITIDGEWKFYWNELLQPQQISSLKPYYASVPTSWGRLGYPTKGYATYSLDIRCNPYQHNLAILFPNISTAYKIWVNNELVRKVGHVGSNSKSTIPGYRGSLIHLPDKAINSKYIRITIQVANFDHYRGGFYQGTILLGNLQTLKSRLNNTRSLELLEVGSLTFMMLYHFILFFYLYKRRDYSPLYLSIICFCIIIRTLIVNVGSQYWYEVFPNSSYYFLITLEFVVTYALIPFMVMFVHALFPQESSKKLIRIFQATGLLLVLTVLFTPSYVFGHSLYVFYIASLAAYGFQIYVVTKAFHRGRSGALTLQFGFLISLVLSFLEVAHHNAWIALTYSNLATLGLFLFLFFQSFVISRRFATAFAQAEDLTNNLEKKVKERTEELKAQNDMVARIND
ncbi:MAG: 7TM-DISM domain-containing protein, partial [Thermonemataceae bacterium]